MPGGHQLYVAEDGALEFTIAHGPTIPAGAHGQGFRIKADGELSYRGNRGRGFLACESPAGGHQIYAHTQGRHEDVERQPADLERGPHRPEECRPVRLLTVPTEGPGGYQYQ